MTVNHDVTGSSPVGGANVARGTERVFRAIFIRVWRSFGSALEWGSRGRRFDSCHSDHKK